MIKVVFSLCFLFASSSMWASFPDSVHQKIASFYDLEYPERYTEIFNYLKTVRPTHEMVYHFVGIEMENIEKNGSDNLTLTKVLLQLSHNELEFTEFKSSAQKIARGKKIILEHGQDSDDWIKQSAKAHFLMSQIHYFEYQTQDAVDEIKAAIEKTAAVKDTFLLLRYYGYAGEYLAELSKYEEALEYHDKVAEIQALPSAPNSSAYSHSSLGRVNCYMALERYAEAKATLNEFIEPSLKRNPKDSHMFYGKVAQLEMLMGNYQKSYQLFQPIINDLHNPEKITNMFAKMAILRNYTDLLKAMGNYKLANVYQDSLFALSREELTMVNESEMAEAKAKYNKLEDEKRISELEYQQEVAASKQRSMLFGFGSLLFAILVGFYFWNYRQKEKQKQQLLLSSKEKETQQIREKLLTSITHELRTPLAIILGKLETLEEAKLNEENQEHLAIAQRNTQELVVQINQLLEWNKLEAKALKNRPTVGDAEQVVENIIEEMKPIAERKNINWNIGVKEQDFEGKIDFEKFKTIVSNLVSNALKYSPNDSNIHIKLFQEKNELICSVQDFGPGIPAKQLDKIFDWYYRVASEENVASYEGFGIGLALSKELAELMGGQLTVSSTVGKGSTFNLRIPFEALIENVATQDGLAQPSVASYSRATSSDEPSILIIEDHPDLAEHIASLFKNDCRVIIAHDIASGKHLAEKEIPDIIVSDIMLPDGSGLDLCKDLKSQLLTDHIPILLLTARIDDQTRFAGLKNRADAFLTKPFNNKELLLTVNNLLQNRRILHLRFGKESAPSSDPFTNLVEETLAEHYSDSEFNIEAFGKALSLSRGQLFKKIRATFDNTPTNLIRNYRLEKARQQLQTGDLQIAEIAYQCGFSSPEYFSTVFREFFKQSPSEFKSEAR